MELSLLPTAFLEIAHAAHKCQARLHAWAFLFVTAAKCPLSECYPCNSAEEVRAKNKMSLAPPLAALLNKKMPLTLTEKHHQEGA